MRAMCAIGAAIAVVGCGGGADVADASLDATSDAPVDARTDAPTDAALDATAWPTLWFDVHYSARGFLSVTASDPARARCTFYEFLRSGCDDIVDFRVCSDPPLAPWITAVRVTSGGQVIASQSPVDIWEGASFVPAQLAGHDQLALVIEASDGQRAEIPIPSGVVPPRPTIESASIKTDGVHLAWGATPPAASTLTAIYSGVGGYRCHVAAPQSEIVMAWFLAQPGDTYDITTFAPAPAIATPLGEAKVWIGSSVTGVLPAP